MDISIEEVSAAMIEPPRELPPPQPAPRAIDPEMILALIRREQSRIERLMAD